MDLSIIIVSWNVEEKLKKNIASIYNSEGDFSFEVFVVDNNSDDNSVDMIKKEFPQVKIIANNENLGFAKANNLGLKYAGGKYVLFLNPDMEVIPDTLDLMLGWMDNHKEAGIAGCRLIDSEGKIILHVRKFPALADQLAIILKLPHLFPKILNSYLRTDFDYDNEAEVDSIRGAFFMIRNEVIEQIGGLDERFFLWFEEVDYCRRAKEAGWKVMYTPVCEAIDHVGQSFKQVKRNKSQRYFRDSMLKYFKKWHSYSQYLILKIAWPLGLLIADISSLFHIKQKTKT